MVRWSKNFYFSMNDCINYPLLIAEVGRVHLFVNRCSKGSEGRTLCFTSYSFLENVVE